MTGWLSPADWDALALSLRVSFLSVLLSLPVALAPLHCAQGPRRPR